ncbi:MAG: hypothetical protein DSM106950_16355 [Stigonema ocellatum SAG 48.90 = DSM 106950]|nr:hypothetical protein [Stigonema ocellatum SAG 48.90 = DSM 106950]
MLQQTGAVVISAVAGMGGVGRVVQAAFELSWQELSVGTQQVATLLSLFAPNIFAWEWVKSASELLNWSLTDVEAANEHLYRFHLIQWVLDTSDEYKIRIYPLIREFLKVKLAASQQSDNLKCGFAEVMVAIAKLIPDSPTQELINSVKDAIPRFSCNPTISTITPFWQPKSKNDFGIWLMRSIFIKCDGDLRYRTSFGKCLLLNCIEKTLSFLNI